MDIIVVPSLMLLKSVLGFSMVIVVSDVILGWLVTANILNVNNQFVCSVVASLATISGLLQKPVRERMPANMGGLDLSPLAFILLASFLEWMLDRVLLRFVM
ncbi:MAG: YggT family protein [Holosporaceae bacterium]|jgi:uncharacterized protein YggT (Ycf19 family)|nr:YggT family protein [Holosporaceae bacterium]